MRLISKHLKPQQILEKAQRLQFWIQSGLVGLAVISLSSHPAWAEAVLTRAEVYNVRNQVDLNRQNRGAWTPASIGDAMVPLDALRTGADSRAELLFNEGTLVRTGASTVFRFPSGRRTFEVIDGSSLFMIPPGLGASNINTPQARVVATGTALFVQHDPNQNTTTVGVLTDSPAGPVRVTNANGDVTVELTGGQFVSVVDGVIGFVDQFVLPMFYSTVDLAVGLGTGQENFVAQQSPQVQATINAVRAETLAPLQQQTAWLQGLCDTGVGDVNLRTVQGLLQRSPLGQWLFPQAVPPEEITVNLPESELLIMPVRSLTGLAWVSNYCQTSSQ